MTESAREHLLTVEEAAERLQVAPITVGRYICRGLLPAVEVGGVIRVRPEDLDDVVRPYRPTPKSAEARRAVAAGQHRRSHMQRTRSDRRRRRRRFGVVAMLHRVPAAVAGDYRPS